MQSIDCEYEIIVGDDCSTDETAKILRSLQARYPNKIRLILRERNVGVSQNFLQVLSEAKGEYIAYSDGDDYWSDPQKLQAQLDVLDKHPSCSFSCHDVTLVSEKEEYLSLMSEGRVNEGWSDGIYSYEHFVTSVLQVPHANSLLMRKSALNLEMLHSVGSFSMGDYIMTCSLAFGGDAYYFAKPMSCYRQVEGSLKRQTSRKTLQRLKKELTENHFRMSRYYKGKYEKELLSHLYGKLMLMEQESYLRSITQDNKKEMLRSLVYMLLYRSRSGYSYRDLLYLIKIFILGRKKALYE